MRLLRTAACLAIAALASSAPAAASGPANGFSDVGPGHWAYAAVSEMGGAGVVAGYPDGSFKPSELVTHGEFIKMAFLAAGRPDPGNSAAGHWASSYYAGSVEAGYFTNLDIPEQSLGYAISRESMALIVSNILGEAEIPGYARIQRGIRDVGPGRAHEYEITKVYAAGIITGYPDKTFRPAGNLSRAEAATVIYRLENEGERVPPDLSEETSAGPTTLDRFYTSVEGNRTGFIGVIMTSTSTLPLTDIVDKITFENSLIAAEYTWETIPEYYKNLKYYEIMDDYPFELKVVPDLVGSVSLDVGFEVGPTRAVLIKDRIMHILESSRSIIWSSRDVGVTDVFPEYDYIGFYHSLFPVMILISNKP